MKFRTIHINHLIYKAALSFVMIWISSSVYGQNQRIIQFSGIVTTKVNSTQIPLPYVGVGILRTRRGTYTNENGFFSMAAQTGDTILFSSLGYKQNRVILPQEVEGENYFQNIHLEQDTFQLESAIVYSIPSKEHFRPEFLEMDVSDKLTDQAQKNISKEVLERLAESTPADGKAAVSLYFAQEAQKAYYEGQFKPQRIFDAMAWVEFFKAMKRGDFKKKKKK